MRSYKKEALVIVAELIERGLRLYDYDELRHKSGLSVFVSSYGAIVSVGKRSRVVLYTQHKSINKVLGYVDGYIAWLK